MTAKKVPLRPLPLLTATLYSLLIVGLGTWYTLSIRAELPAKIATHWGFDGQADGFSTIEEALWFSGIFIPLFALFLVGMIGVFSRMSGASAAFSIGVSTFLGGIFYFSLIFQKGITDPAEASGSDAAMGLSLLAGLATGLLAAYVFQRRKQLPPFPRPGLPADALLLPASASARISFTGTTRLPRFAFFGYLLFCASMITFSIIMLAASGSWFIFLIGLLPCTLVLLLRFNIAIDSKGVHLALWKRIAIYHVPLGEISAASATRVEHPLREFGGWGTRSSIKGDGTFGVITGAGEALRFSRLGELGDIVITVDNAETAAATLNTLINQDSAAAS